MPIDLQSESLLSLSEATRALPALDGRRVHTATIWRWCRRGCRGLHLEHARLGHRVVTSAEALSRFANRLAELDGNVTRPPAPEPAAPFAPRGRTPRQREKDIARAEAELAAVGV